MYYAVRTYALRESSISCLQVVTGGNIITSNMIFMKFRQKTFSLALSRDMVPNAKIVAYCVLNTGEILADSLAFFVKGIRNDGVRTPLRRC